MLQFFPVNGLSHLQRNRMSHSADAFSSKLSPNEIKNKEFKRTMWGYSPKEVIEFLDTTAKTWEKVQKHEKDLLHKIEKLKEEIKSWELREAQIQKIHEKAIKDAEQIRIEATDQAEKIFREVEDRANQVRLKTEEWLVNVIAEVEETERQKSNFITAFKSALDSHYALIQEEKEAESLGTKLNQFLKSEVTEKGVPQ